jgi:hypothetical protein
MTYILTAQMMDDGVEPGTPFRRYQEYLRRERERFPRGAYALATSGWYYDFSDHRCPHDAWLEELAVLEHGSGDRKATRGVEIRVRLLGAYHDGHIEMRYHGVVRYRCEMWPRTVSEGHAHGDWRYDEFRLSESGLLLHEIEWWSYQPTGTWLIEAADVEHRWTPFEPGPDRS